MIVGDGSNLWLPKKTVSTSFKDPGLLGEKGMSPPSSDCVSATTHSCLRALGHPVGLGEGGTDCSY